MLTFSDSSVSSTLLMFANSARLVMMFSLLLIIWLTPYLAPTSNATYDSLSCSCRERGWIFSWNLSRNPFACAGQGLHSFVVSFNTGLPLQLDSSQLQREPLVTYRPSGHLLLAVLFSDLGTASFPVPPRQVAPEVHQASNRSKEVVSSSLLSEVSPGWLCQIDLLRPTGADQKLQESIFWIWKQYQDFLLGSDT